MPGFYQKHILFCSNQKEQGKKCCADGGGEQAFETAKDYLKQRGLWGPGKVRVSRTGCLGRCSHGPVCVVYPEASWYTYTNQCDIIKVLEHHLSKDYLLLDHNIALDFKKER